jgi:hypothetical protein
MGIVRRFAATTSMLGVMLGSTSGALATPYEELTSGRRALYTAGAAAANALPVASALVEPRCLQGYILCKVTFAAFSVIAAAESVVMSGGADRDQPRAILYRGFSGDWVLTPKDVAGDTKPDLLPEPPPPAEGGEKREGEFVPPPL